MKIKTDFVTNSSSTSFIIANKKKTEGKELKAKVTIDLSSLIEQEIKTVQELDDYIKEWYYDEKSIVEAKKEDKWKNALEIIQNGGVIYILVGSNEDDNEISQMLYNNGLGNIQFEDEIVILVKDKW